MHPLNRQPGESHWSFFPLSLKARWLNCTLSRFGSLHGPFYGTLQRPAFHVFTTTAPLPARPLPFSFNELMSLKFNSLPPLEIGISASPAVPFLKTEMKQPSFWGIWRDRCFWNVFLQVYLKNSHIIPFNFKNVAFLPYALVDVEYYKITYFIYIYSS